MAPMTGSSTAAAKSSLPPSWPTRRARRSATRASGMFTSVRPATTATNAGSIRLEVLLPGLAGVATGHVPIYGSDGTPGIAREAPHDLTLGVIREQAAVAGE